MVMTLKQTIDMAREAGAIHIHEKPKEFALVGNEALKAFEALVRADEREEFQRWFVGVITQHAPLILAEREACAKVCEDAFSSSHAGRVVCDNLAYAIRNRGNT
jgi:hypothetical protein